MGGQSQRIVLVVCHITMRFEVATFLVGNEIWAIEVVCENALNIDPCLNPAKLLISFRKMSMKGVEFCG